MKKIKLKDIVLLQIAVIIYTFSSVVAKIASSRELPQFLLLFGIEIVILGIYAVLWQQIIKKIDLSVAYANKAMTIIWSMLWSIILFEGMLTFQNIIGICLVVAGIIVINNETDSEESM